MARPQLQFNTRSLFAIVFFVALALAAMRDIEASISSNPPDPMRMIICLCLIGGCSFGISGLVVGWPVRGFLFGFCLVGLVIAALTFAAG